MGIPDAQKWKRTFKNISKKDFCRLYFTVVLQYNVQIATIYFRDTGNIFLGTQKDNWDKSYDHHFLSAHSLLLGKQHIKITGWCSFSFNSITVLPKFVQNWPKIDKINVAEHHPEVVLH